MTLPVNPEAASIVQNEPFIDTRNARREAVTLNSATVDSGNSPTTQLRKGLVVGRDSGTDTWYNASNAAVDANTPAFVDSDEAPDSDWDTTTTTLVNDGKTYTFTYASVTNLADAIAELEADPEIANSFDFANDGSGNLRITSKEAGTRLSVSSDLASAYGGVTVVSTDEFNAFGILEETIVSTLDINGTATKRRATVITRNAVVRGSLLLDMTDEARETLKAQNIQFFDES